MNAGNNQVSTLFKFAQGEWKMSEKHLGEFRCRHWALRVIYMNRTFLQLEFLLNENMYICALCDKMSVNETKKFPFEQHRRVAAR